MSRCFFFFFLQPKAIRKQFPPLTKNRSQLTIASSQHRIIWPGCVHSTLLIGCYHGSFWRPLLSDWFDRSKDDWFFLFSFHFGLRFHRRVCGNWVCYWKEKDLCSFSTENEHTSWQESALTGPEEGTKALFRERKMTFETQTPTARHHCRSPSNKNRTINHKNSSRKSPGFQTDRASKAQHSQETETMCLDSEINKIPASRPVPRRTRRRNESGSSETVPYAGAKFSSPPPPSFLPRPPSHWIASNYYFDVDTRSMSQHLRMLLRVDA